MQRFSTVVVVHASQERVWLILTDAGGYHRWSSTVENITGSIASGEIITVRTHAFPGHAFHHTIEDFEPPQRMQWVDRAPLGLLWRRRTFTLTPTDAGAVLVEILDEIRRWLAPLIIRALPTLQKDLDAFAADLKRQAERGTPPASLISQYRS